MKYDTESLKKQAVVDFSSRRRTNKNNQADHKTKDQLEMKALIEEAKQHALEEINTFRTLMEQTKKECSNMVLFKDVPRIIDDIFIHMILEQVTEPIVKGNLSPGMDPVFFKELRKDMYRDLIQAYCKKD